MSRMQRKRVHRVAKTIPEPQFKELPSIKLDDIHIFAEIAKHGSVRKAATLMGRNPNLLIRRIGVLEHQAGRLLFHRSNKGMNLTKDGKELFSISNEFIEKSKDVLGFIHRQKDLGKATSVVGVTEGLGTFWLMPRLVEFHRENPDTLLDFRCRMSPASLTDHDADISVQVAMPTDDDVIVTRIGYLHVMLFASVDYINEHGAPSALEELPHYHLVEQKSAQIETKLLSEYFPGVPLDFVTMKTNTSSSHAYAVARGAGIGALPTYARALTKRLVPVCDGFHFRKEIYMAYLKDTKQSVHNMVVADWLRNSFNPKKYPWFAEEFVHPDEFEPNIRSGNIVQMFDGFEQ